MNKELFNLYTERCADFSRIIQQFQGVDLAGPLLMSPNALYKQQQTPLLIVGQETKGWGYLHGNAIQEQMAVYEEFNVAEGYYPSPFWNVTRKVEKALGNAPHSCAWTNISKFDVEGGRSFGKQAQAISAVDDLLIAEIRIIKPKVCLFFTGPDFDNRLQHILPGLTYHAVPNWPERGLARLAHLKLPPSTFRTYHPNYLRRSGLEPDFIQFIAAMETAE